MTIPDAILVISRTEGAASITLLIGRRWMLEMPIQGTTPLPLFSILALRQICQHKALQRRRRHPLPKGMEVKMVTINTTIDRTATLGETEDTMRTRPKAVAHKTRGIMEIRARRSITGPMDNISRTEAGVGVVVIIRARVEAVVKEAVADTIKGTVVDRPSPLVIYARLSQNCPESLISRCWI